MRIVKLTLKRSNKSILLIQQIANIDLGRPKINGGNGQSFHERSERSVNLIHLFLFENTPTPYYRASIGHISGLPLGEHP